jgi:hypothetical protein
VPADNDAIKKVVERIYAYADSRMDADHHEVYDVGLCLLALDAVQHTDDADYAQAPDKRMKSCAEKLAFALFRNRGPRGGWYYFGKTDGDLSNSQYGALGLWAATRLGVPMPNGLWDSVAQYVLRVHQKDVGGFTYHDRIRKDAPTVSMTAAAIGTLALAFRQSTKKEIVREAPPVTEDYDALQIGERKAARAPAPVKPKPMTEIEMAVERGFKWWVTPGFVQKDAYYWYATERAYTLTNTQTQAGAPWFEALAQQILPEQKADGSWKENWDVTCDTAWALLALTRATKQMVRIEDDYEKAERLAKEKKKAAGADAPPAEAAKPETKPATTADAKAAPPKKAKGAADE